MIWILWLPVTLAAPRVFPLVDPGLFVISGVKTCGGGGGYCLLGLDCTLDEDFLPDDEDGQHCEGLRSAFTPSAHFVCCRATNKTAYKPPIVFPSVLTTAHTESMTSRTTTLSVLENEIDQVLLKVAQSVDSAKKSPVTEATKAHTNIVDEEKTAELRESAEKPSSQDSYEQEYVMMADSPEQEELQDMLEEVGFEDKSEEENSNTSEDIHSNIPHKPKPSEIPPQIDNVESSLDKSKDENTISFGKDSKESENQHSDSSDYKYSNDKASPEEESIGDLLKEDNLAMSSENDENPMLFPTIFKNVSKLPLDHVAQGSQSNITIVMSGSKGNGTKEGTESKIKILPENTLDTPLTTNTEQVDVLKDGPVRNFSNENTSLKNDQSNPHLDGPTPNLTLNPIETGFETVENEPNNPTEQDLNLKVYTDPNLNEIVMSTSNIESQDNSLHNILKESKTPINDATEMNTEEDSITTQTKSSSDEQENQFDMSTTMFPATQTPDKNQTSNTMDNNQGHAVLTDPCSRVNENNCSKEIKFIFLNQTLCFGSVYALDWVVTSASCALRIFRAGMLNVEVTPLTEAKKGFVKTIIVHESYGENTGTTGQELEANNIGLVQLKTPMVEWSQCVPCLPQPGQDMSNAKCTAVTSLPLAAPTTNNCPVSAKGCKSLRADNSVNSCQDVSRVIKDDHGFPYLTLACDTLWEPRFTDSIPRGSGAPLFCDNMLAGVEGSTGVGLMIYTPISPYINWLLKNTRSGLPEQHFNLG